MVDNNINLSYSLSQRHKAVNYHPQRGWLDILALKGALLDLVVILCLGAFAHRFYRFFCRTEVVDLDLILANCTHESIHETQNGAPKVLPSFF
jgi:hypothetical protein